MDAMSCDCKDEEIADLIKEIAGDDRGEVSETQFLHFVKRQLVLPPEEELIEAWRVTKNMAPGKEGTALDQVTARDVQLLMKKLGEELPDEEADELIMQADKNDKKFLDFDDFVHLLHVPSGGE